MPVAQTAFIEHSVLQNLTQPDHFAGAVTARPGSLLADPRIEDRVVYMRSFSKVLAPDLRIAIAVARSRLRAYLVEAKRYADGWTSRVTQRALAYVLADEELGTALRVACETYGARRAAIAHELASQLVPSGRVLSGADGVNIWIRLPSDTDASEVIEHAAARGVLLTPGEPFYIRPGRSDVIRLSIGDIKTEQAAAVGRTVAQAAAAYTGPVAISV